MIPRAWFAVVAAVLLGTAAAGCSSSATASATSGADDAAASMPIVHGLETTNLIVSDFPAIDSGGLYVAENDGFFAQEGLHVTVIPDFLSSQDTVDKIESGKAQISSGDYVTYMNDLVGHDSNIMIIAEGAVLQPDVMALMVGPSTKIRSLKQLEGQKIPISGIHDIGSLLIDSVLTGNGVPFTSVKYVPGIPLSAVPAMVKAGKFKAGPAAEPSVSEGEEQYGDTVLADLDQGAATDFPLTGYSVTRRWAKRNPNTLKAFVTALEEGQEIAGTDRPALEKALRGKPLKVPADAAATISLPGFPTGIDPARLQRVMSDMIDFNFLTGRQLTLAEHFDAKNVVYAANLATASGQSNLLGS